MGCEASNWTRRLKHAVDRWELELTLLVQEVAAELAKLSGKKYPVSPSKQARADIHIEIAFRRSAAVDAPGQELPTIQLPGMTISGWLGALAQSDASAPTVTRGVIRARICS